MQQENAHTQACYSDNSGPKQRWTSSIDVRNEPSKSTDIGHDKNPEPDFQVRDFLGYTKLPLGARFPTGKIFREDRFPVPLDALREILLNAVMHRDYSHHSGYVAIAIFDDRIEIRSYGRLPNGVTVKQLSGRHDSKPTNPLIAGAFHRTGAVEVWGRRTNRVIAARKEHGAAPPVFEERQGFLIVTFRARMVTEQVTTQVTPQVDQQATPQVMAVLETATQPASAEALQHAAGLKDRVHFLRSYLQRLIGQGWLERTIPDKPRSRMQKYRTTEAGRAALKEPERKS